MDFRTHNKDAFVEAQLSMLSPGLRNRMKLHFCGSTGANAVDPAVSRTATGRGDLVCFQGGFHGQQRRSENAAEYRSAQLSMVPGDGGPDVGAFLRADRGGCSFM